MFCDNNILFMPKKLHAGLQVIDHWLKYQMAQGDLPGFQVSIRNNGKLVYSKAFGYADLKNKVHYSRKHKGRIASQSKTFTAAILLWLESRGFLDLNELIVKYLPELTKHKDHNFKKIKIIHLLNHRSGIHRDSFDRDYWGKKEKFLTNKELINDILLTRLIYRPDQYTKYSNINYALLGLVLERATGKSFKKLTEEFLIACGFNGSINHDCVLEDNLSKGYIRCQLDRQKFIETKHRSALSLAPAAGFCASTDSVTDFFHRLYLTNTVINTKQRQKILSKKWLVKNTISDKYGLGTIFFKLKGENYIGHAGGFPGFSSQTWVIPSTKYTFGFIANNSMLKSFNVVYSMVEIMKAINSNFKPNEAVLVSVPMADNFSATIYVVSKSKALAFPLSGWLPTEDVMIFNRQSDYYISNAINGFKSVNEPLRILISKGEIRSVKFGGFNSRPVR